MVICGQIKCVFIKPTFSCFTLIEMFVIQIKLFDIKIMIYIDAYIYNVHNYVINNIMSHNTTLCMLMPCQIKIKIK